MRSLLHVFNRSKLHGRKSPLPTKRVAQSSLRQATGATNPMLRTRSTTRTKHHDPKPMQRIYAVQILSKVSVKRAHRVLCKSTYLLSMLLRKFLGTNPVSKRQLSIHHRLKLCPRLSSRRPQNTLQERRQHPHRHAALTKRVESKSQRQLRLTLSPRISQLRYNSSSSSNR